MRKTRMVPAGILLASLLLPTIGFASAGNLASSPVARLVRSVPIDQKMIALSFDDGPSPVYTPKVLSVLASDHATATFFVIGQEAERHPELLLAERKARMEIGNHGMHHVTLKGKSAPEVEAEVREGQRVIRAITGKAPVLYRLPRGVADEVSLRVLGKLGYTVAAWSIDPRDYLRRTPEAMAQDILKAAAPGRILILHDGGGPRQASVDALALVLPKLRSEGYRLVGIEEMLKAAHFPILSSSRMQRAQ